MKDTSRAQATLIQAHGTIMRSCASYGAGGGETQWRSSDFSEGPIGLQEKRSINPNTPSSSTIRGHGREAKVGPAST